jgi:cell division septal protein FtsQ
MTWRLRKSRKNKAGQRLVIRREYDSRKFVVNPSRKGLKGDYRWRWLGISTLALAIYLIFFSPVFIATDFDIVNNHLISDEKILQAGFPNGFKPLNVLLMNETKIKRSIVKQILQIEDVKFKKDLLHQRLLVDIKERDTAIIWQSNNERFLINRDGVVYDVASIDSPLVVVEDLKNVPVTLGQKIVAREFVEFISAVSANLPRQTGLTIRRVTVPETTFEVEIETSAGWKLILDTTRSWENQLNNLMRVLQQLNPADQQKLNYVDLRIPDRVYYK